MNHSLVTFCFPEPRKTARGDGSKNTLAQGFSAMALQNVAVVLGPDNHLYTSRHNVCRAAHRKRSAVDHVGIDHGGAHALRAKEFLDRADVLPILH